MPKITFISSDGESVEVDAKSGESLMQAAVNNMVDGVAAECGGSLSCGTCHVYIDDAWRETVGTPAGDEAGMLGLVVEPNDSSRLSCQIMVTDALDGLVIRLPESQF